MAQDIRGHLAGLGITHLDILVNDAGLYSEKLVRTDEGVELTLAVNHIAPFLLTHELLMLLRAGPTGRVITVTSDMHFNAWINLKRLNSPFPYIGLWAYMVSKLANVLFTLELNRRLIRTQVVAFAVDPGLVNTRIASKGSPGISSLVWNTRRSAGSTPEVPARTILYLAGEPSIQNTRDFYWRDLRPMLPSRRGRDERMGRALWEKSLQICGISQDNQEVAP